MTCLQAWLAYVPATTVHYKLFKVRLTHLSGPALKRASNQIRMPEGISIKSPWLEPVILARKKTKTLPL
jgi:hypothetical protein